jgi:hypothetical protein
VGEDKRMKTNKVKPTKRQKLAFDNLVELGSTKKEALVKAGYSEKTAVAPTKVTESRGFITLMEEAGLTDEFLNNCLYEDIEAKPKNRKAEIELAYKLKGHLKDKDENSNRPVIINIPSIIAETFNINEATNNKTNRSPSKQS